MKAGPFTPDIYKPERPRQKNKTGGKHIADVLTEFSGVYSVGAVVEFVMP